MHFSCVLLYSTLLCSGWLPVLNILSPTLILTFLSLGSKGKSSLWTGLWSSGELHPFPFHFIAIIFPKQRACSQARVTEGWLQHSPSHQCDRGSNTRVDSICGSSLLLVPSFALPERFFSWYSGFLLSSKTNISQFWFDLWKYCF